MDMSKVHCEVVMSDEERAQMDDVAKKFPKFKGASHCVCEISAGEMLFLPAGWFHEVRSYNSPPRTSGGGEGRGGHVAFNYWFHPPDVCIKGEKGFLAPYSSEYWEHHWGRRAGETVV